MHTFDLIIGLNIYLAICLFIHKSVATWLSKVVSIRDEMDDDYKRIPVTFVR